MEKLNEVIEFVAHRVMFSRLRTGNGSETVRALDYFASVDECIENHRGNGHG